MNDPFFGLTAKQYADQYDANKYNASAMQNCTVVASRNIKTGEELFLDYNQ